MEFCNQFIGTQVTRYDQYTYLYVTRPDRKLIYYHSNPMTSFQYKEEVIRQDAISQPSLIRFYEAFDIYYVNTKHELMHSCLGEWTKWKHTEFSKLDSNVSNKKPVSVRNGNKIDIFYWKQTGELVHRHVSDKIKWKYTTPKVLEIGGGNNLCAIINKDSTVELFYEKQGKLQHINSDSNFEQNPKPVEHSQIPLIKSGSPIKAVNDNVFYIAENNQICQLICSMKGHSKNYKFAAYLEGACPDSNEFSVVKYQKHLDLYFINKNTVYHAYCGPRSDGHWRKPKPISDQDAHYGLNAIRIKQTAIDVYYMTENGTLRHLSVGFQVSSGWRSYSYMSSITRKIPKHTSHRKIISIEKLFSHHKCVFHDQGWNAIAFTAQIDAQQYIVKKFKRAQSFLVEKEMTTLERLSQAFPGILHSEVTENNVLVGFVMKKFQGVKVDSLIEAKTLTKIQKMEIIISFAQEVKKIQELGICHSDLHVRNLIISDENKVSIIDYGNAILFDSKTLTTFDLTGTAFMRPPQYFKGKYCPVGVNAFQFARIALNIWTQVNYKKFWSLKDSNEEIEIIKKNEIERKFFEPIIELLNIKNPFERLVSKELIQSLKNVQTEYRLKMH